MNDDIEAPTRGADLRSDTDRFRFVWPARAISKRSRLRSINIGEITHEVGSRCAASPRELMHDVAQGRVEVLHTFLEDTLSGDSRSLVHRSSDYKGTDVHQRAMVLTQFACQYTMHCVDQLQTHSSALEERLRKLHLKRDQLTQQRKCLSRKKSSRSKELELTMSALDDIDRIVSQLADINALSGSSSKC
ncbi:hypothetical protein PINS_up000086 [Pythium insidiosum]|nr:hypothetical protein PINS_up000086 [Pythium insidiosum]